MKFCFNDKSRIGWWFVNKPHTFRYDPVPTIRHARYGLRYYRRPRTTQERRVLMDFEHRRFSRVRVLPHSYDDLWFSDVRPKSWKDCTRKKRQWM